MEAKNMKDLIKLYRSLVSKLPKSAKTKIQKSSLDRGYNGVFTKRRKRSDKVIIPFISFKEIWLCDLDKINKTYLNGFRVLCTPFEYVSNIELLVDIPLIVRYQTYDEVEEYPLSIDWNNVKNDRNSYMNNEIMFVQDIKNLDKHGNSGKSKYLGPNLIGQHEMDYATDDEILKVQMCLLFQMIKTYDFNEVMSEHPLFEKYLEYSEKFIHTTLFLDNPKIQEYSVTYGCTVCPEMVKFPNKQCSMISFKDIVCGVIEGDMGREDFNRTTTKVNLHHVDRLISGKLNHNHKNVFLGSATGNMINAALFIRGCEVSDLFNG
jgi:hypothetical protein